jgi:hypothetical protein
LKQLLQLNNPGSTQANSIPVPNPDLGNQTIPDQPVQSFDFGSWTPDYAAAGGGYGDNSD